MSMSESLNHSFNQFNFRIIYWINHPIQCVQNHWFFTNEVSFFPSPNSFKCIDSFKNQTSVISLWYITESFFPPNSFQNEPIWVSHWINPSPKLIKNTDSFNSCHSVLLKYLSLFYFCTGAKKRFFFYFKIPCLIIYLLFLCNYLWNVPLISEWKLLQSKFCTILVYFTGCFKCLLCVRCVRALYSCVYLSMFICMCMRSQCMMTKPAGNAPQSGRWDLWLKRRTQWR